MGEVYGLANYGRHGVYCRVRNVPVLLTNRTLLTLSLLASRESFVAGAILQAPATLYEGAGAVNPGPIQSARWTHNGVLAALTDLCGK